MKTGCSLVGCLLCSGREAVADDDGSARCGLVAGQSERVVIRDHHHSVVRLSGRLLLLLLVVVVKDAADWTTSWLMRVVAEVLLDARHAERVFTPLTACMHRHAHTHDY